MLGRLENPPQWSTSLVSSTLEQIFTLFLSSLKKELFTHISVRLTHTPMACVFVHAVPRRSSPSIWPIKTLASCNAHLLLDILKIYLYSFKLKQKVAIVTDSQCLILPLPICVPVGRLLTLLKTEFPHLKMGLLTTT